MTQYVELTARARRDCARISVDEDEARDVVDSPDRVEERPDPGDPSKVFSYSVRRLTEDAVLVVTWEQLADRRRAYRVSLLHPDELD